MKVFIAIGNLGCGGAQKSLVSLLSLLKPSDGMDIDLLVMDERKPFFNNLPDWINRLTVPNELRAMFLPYRELKVSDLSKSIKTKAMCAKIIKKIHKNQKADTVQKVWSSWKAFIPKQEKRYDLAISYVDGFSNYYVMDNVLANKKILWVHNEYEKLRYIEDYDYPYFSKADKIVTISDRCVDSLKRVFPELSDKFVMLPNLSSQQSINELAMEGVPDEYKNHENIFVSIGRLNEQKGFDVAVKAAKKLKDQGLDFCWFVIGKGELQDSLQSQIIEYGVEEQFKLIGTRSNPYPYIKYSTLFIQPSRYEGKSIVLDEAKILTKPIVVTNYTTVFDSITDGINGTIVSFDENSIAKGITKLLGDKDLQDKYVNELEKENLLNGQTVKAYIDVFKNV